MFKIFQQDDFQDIGGIPRNHVGLRTINICMRDFVSVTNHQNLHATYDSFTCDVIVLTKWKKKIIPIIVNYVTLLLFTLYMSYVMII